MYQQLEKKQEHVNTAKPNIQRKEQPNRTGLPDNLKDGIQRLSGYDMSDVKVHYNSSKPAQLNAHAYAQGTQIHLGAGQERHLPHEAWHVVQQKQGRVRPTMKIGGQAINDNIGLEKEADVMGGKALQMKVKNNSVVQKSSDSKDKLGNFNNQLKIIQNPKPSLQFKFDLVGEIYDIAKLGIKEFLNKLTDENKEIFEQAIKGKEGEELIRMGTDKDNTYDFVSILMNIQSDNDYKTYLEGDKGHSFKEYDDFNYKKKNNHEINEKDNLKDKYDHEKVTHKERLDNFPAHSVMPYDDRYLNYTEAEHSYNLRYEEWKDIYNKDNNDRHITGAIGSKAGKNMIIDTYTWEEIKKNHVKKKYENLTHRDATSGSGVKETNEWYEVFDLLIENKKSKVTFNFHIGVLKNELPYSKKKNIKPIYKYYGF